LARNEIAEKLRAVDLKWGSALRCEAISLAHEISKQWLDHWYAEAQPAAESMYVEATRRFVDLANSFFEKLEKSGVAGLSTLPRAVNPETGFRVRSRLFYTSIMTLTSPTLFEWIMDQLRPRNCQLKALDRQVGEYLERLLSANAHRIESDFNERVLESRRRFQYEIRNAILEALTSSERGLTLPCYPRSLGDFAVVELCKLPIFILFVEFWIFISPKS
jgi:hypothetical protein